MTKLIEDSIIQIRDSLKELADSSKYLQDQLLEWHKRFDSTSSLSEEEKSLAGSQYGSLIQGINSIIQDIEGTTALAKKASTASDLEHIIERKKSLYNLFRICLSQYASLVTCLNWQSPSIKSTQDMRVGVEKATIEADWNDYKRDRSSDTFSAEAMFENNIIKTSGTGEKSVLNLFNSGMAAFTGILYFLICEDIISNKVLASSQIYVESRMLLKKFFPTQLETFDHNNTKQIIEKILKTKPNVVFIEPLTNTNDLRLFDVLEIVKSVSSSYTEEIYFILDVTCIVGYENIFESISLPGNIKVILHGSLLKSPQLGLERVNVGFVQTYGLGKSAHKILDYRTLSGTNIQDFATNLLPFTTKDHLRKRMKVIEKNAIYLASAFKEVDPEGKVVAEVIYPTLPAHPDHDLAVRLGFAGSFFNIKLTEQMNNDEYFAIFTNIVIKNGRRYGCNIVHGASFGFNHTTIYYSVGWDEPENHYIRISTGTETPYEVEKIKQVLVESYDDFKLAIQSKANHPS